MPLNFLVEHPWITDAAFGLLILLGPFVAAWLVPRPRIARVLAAVAVGPLLALTLLPVDRVAEHRCAIGSWSLAGFSQPEPAANILLLAVPVLLLGVATRRPLAALVAGCAASAAIEIIQALIPSIGRSCTASDWLWNAIGASLGAILAVAALRLAGRRSTPASSGDDREALAARPRWRP